MIPNRLYYVRSQNDDLHVLLYKKTRGSSYTFPKGGGIDEQTGEPYQYHTGDSIRLKPEKTGGIGNNIGFSTSRNTFELLPETFKLEDFIDG